MHPRLTEMVREERRGELIRAADRWRLARTSPFRRGVLRRRPPVDGSLHPRWKPPSSEWLGPAELETARHPENRHRRD